MDWLAPTNGHRWGGGAHLSGEGDTRDRSGERNYGKITAAVVTSCAFTRTVLIFCVSLSPLLPPCSSAYNPMLHVLSLCLSSRNEWRRIYIFFICLYLGFYLPLFKPWLISLGGNLDKDKWALYLTLTWGKPITLFTMVNISEKIIQIVKYNPAKYLFDRKKRGFSNSENKYY